MFDWIEAGNAADLLAKLTEPVTPPDPSERKKIVVGWWNNSSSGLTAEIMTAVETELKTYLSSQGYDLTNLDLVIRNYDGNLATTAPMIISDADVDVVLGYGVNLKSQGNVDYIDRIGDIKMGGKTGRYIYQLADNTDAKLVYDWLQTDSAKAILATEGV